MIFSTRFECIFTYSRLFSSVVFSAKAIVSDAVTNFNLFQSTTAQTLGEIRVNYTRNEWERSETTLETDVEDVHLHSKRVEKTNF